MNIQKIKAEHLNPAAYNPRKDLKPSDKEYKKLKQSIETFGYVEPILWNSRTGNVISGHQRLKVLIELGYAEIDCTIVDYDEQKEKALNIALNKIGGDWNEDKLAELIANLDANAFDVSLTGFDAAEVDDLMNQFYAKEAVEDDFNMDEEKEKIEKSGGTITQLGDIWLLGNHRLMCGDSTSAEDFEKLMNGKHAQCAVTSPPAAEEKDYSKSGITPWLEATARATKNICKHSDIICWQMNDLYNTGTQFIEPTGMFSIQMFGDCGYRPIWIRVWKKQGKAGSTSHMTSSKPQQQYEYITAFAGRETEIYNDQEFVWVSAFAGHSYKFVKRLSKDERKKWGYAGVWEMAAVRSDKSRPDMFPIELPWRCLKMHSDRGEVVLDPFAGCGATIIAAEQLERYCYAMEFSPVYCDLTVKRWEEFTGEKAVRMERGGADA